MVANIASAVPKVERLKRAKPRRRAAAGDLRRAGAAKPGGGRAGKGAEIRARIAANRAKRLAIADAMKREAGVTEHTVHRDKEDLSGLAYIGTGRILSPEGRRIVELYTLAHECGHIFLHNAGEGYWLPGHVKELEAESYAHHAFRAHGMRVPRRIGDWGRHYVGTWIAKDRAAGIPIDPRAVAYASGRRSPYAPLRMVPATWSAPPAAGPVPTEWPAALPAGTPAGQLRLGVRSRQHAGDTTAAPEAAPPKQRSWLRRRLDRISAGLAPIVHEARAVLRLASAWTVFGSAVSLYGLLRLEALYPAAVPSRVAALSWLGLLAAATGGLLIANLAVLWRTATRLRRARPRPTKGAPALVPDAR